MPQFFPLRVIVERVVQAASTAIDVVLTPAAAALAVRQSGRLVMRPVEAAASTGRVQPTRQRIGPARPGLAAVTSSAGAATVQPSTAGATAETSAAGASTIERADAGMALGDTRETLTDTSHVQAAASTGQWKNAANAEGDTSAVARLGKDGLGETTATQAGALTLTMRTYDAAKNRLDLDAAVLVVDLVQAGTTPAVAPGTVSVDVTPQGEAPIRVFTSVEDVAGPVTVDLAPLVDGPWADWLSGLEVVVTGAVTATAVDSHSIEVASARVEVTASATTPA